MTPQRLGLITQSEVSPGIYLSFPVSAGLSSVTANTELRNS